MSILSDAWFEESRIPRVYYSCAGQGRAPVPKGLSVQEKAQYCQTLQSGAGVEDALQFTELSNAEKKSYILYCTEAGIAIQLGNLS